MQNKPGLIELHADPSAFTGVTISVTQAGTCVTTESIIHVHTLITTDCRNLVTYLAKGQEIFINVCS